MSVPEGFEPELTLASASLCPGIGQGLSLLQWNWVPQGPSVSMLPSAGVSVMLYLPRPLISQVYDGHGAPSCCCPSPSQFLGSLF